MSEYIYPEFLRAEVELVRGCNNHMCNTKYDCLAYGVKQKNMPLTKAQKIVDYFENDHNIEQIFLFASGDSTEWPYASKLRIPEKTKSSISIVYPFDDKFPSHLKRMYRVNSVEEIEILSEKIRNPSVVHFIMSTDILKESALMLKKLSLLQNKYNFRLTVKSYNYYTQLGPRYVSWEVVKKLLNNENIEYEKVYKHYTSNNSIFVNHLASSLSHMKYKVTCMEKLKKKDYIINKNSPLPIEQWAFNVKPS